MSSDSVWPGPVYYYLYPIKIKSSDTTPLHSLLLSSRLDFNGYSECFTTEHLITKYVTHLSCLMLSQNLEDIHLSIQYCELSVKLHYVTTKRIFKSIWYSWIQVAKITSYCMEFSCYLETGDYVMLQHSNTFNSRDILKRWPIMMPCSVWRRSHHRNLDWSWSNI